MIDLDSCLLWQGQGRIFETKNIFWIFSAAVEPGMRSQLLAVLKIQKEISVDIYERSCVILNTILDIGTALLNKYI